MFHAPFAAMAFVVLVSAGPIHESDPTSSQMSASERSAAMRSLVERATECIATRVSADTRLDHAAFRNLTDLIVDSVPSCLEPVRAMIDAYDSFYGEGSGEAFFLGPYLDVLPKALVRRQQATDIAPNLHSRDH
jgi:hypothetical protein